MLQPKDIGTLGNPSAVACHPQMGVCMCTWSLHALQMLMLDE